MKFLIETKSGRKGIKSFNDLNEYIDYMTQYGDKIKTIVESDLPYNDKPVKMVKVSGSKGWGEIESSAFGDIASDGEKGESVMSGDGKESIVKDDAEFSWTAPSEKEDKHEEPKVEKPDYMPKEQKQETPKVADKKQTSDNSEKEDKEDKEDKDEKKEDIKEAVEVQPDMFGGKDVQYNDGVRAYTFSEINDYMLEHYKDLDLIDSNENGSQVALKYGAYGSKVDFKTLKDDIESKFEGVKVLRARSQYAPEITSIILVYEEEQELDEGFKDNMKKFGNAAKKGLAMGAVAAGTMMGAHQAQAQNQNYNTYNNRPAVVQQSQNSQYNNKLSAEDEELAKNGQDPFADGALNSMTDYSSYDNTDNNSDMDDPYYDGAQSNPMADDYEAPQIKKTLPNGNIIDQFGNEWTKKEFEQLKNGEDPFADEAYTPNIDSMIAECIKISQF